MNAKAAFAKLSGHQRIAGHLVHSSGGAAINVSDPATEERIGQIADATAADIDQAVAAANSAQRGWRSVNFHRRGGIQVHGWGKGSGGRRPPGGKYGPGKRKNAKERVGRRGLVATAPPPQS